MTLRSIPGRLDHPRTHASALVLMAFDFFPLLAKGDSYGSRRGVFCFVADCPVREDSR